VVRVDRFLPNMLKTTVITQYPVSPNMAEILSAMGEMAERG